MLADTMLNLLLVPLTDPRWIELFEELEQNGSVLSKKMLSPKAFEYTLSKLGVRLYTDANGWVMNVHFVVGPEYQCDLPFGLKPGCKASDVHQLIGSPCDADPVQKRESFSFVGRDEKARIIG